MSKDPAFLFYSSDFITGVQDLTMEERGQYITLLCIQHQKGHLSEKTIKISVGNAAADVMAKFRQDSAGLWYNDRLEVEAEKRRVHSSKQKERAIEGWKKRKSMPNESVGNAAALPLEDVNENVIEDESKNELEDSRPLKIQIQEAIFSDEIFMDQLKMTHKGKDLKEAWEECWTHHSAGPSPPRESWEWRQKLNTWLSIKKHTNNGIGGFSKKTTAGVRLEPSGNYTGDNAKL